MGGRAGHHSTVRTTTVPYSTVTRRCCSRPGGRAHVSSMAVLTDRGGWRRERKGRKKIRKSHTPQMPLCLSLPFSGMQKKSNQVHLKDLYVRVRGPAILTKRKLVWLNGQMYVWMDWDGMAGASRREEGFAALYRWWIFLGTLGLTCTAQVLRRRGGECHPASTCRLP